MTWRDKLAQKANGMLPAGEYGMYLKRELLEIVTEIDSLISERDEARQMYCNAMTDHCEEHEARQIAKEQGWDCFTEDGK